MSFQFRTPFFVPSELASARSSRPSIWRRLAMALALTFATWRDRKVMRRSLAQMDCRSLRDAGISPAAAAYESGKPFWRPVGGLR